MADKITRREMIKHGALGGIAALGAGSFLLSYKTIQAAEPSSAENKKTNILFIFADDWGWGDLGCHGSKIYQTPNLDKLASQGTDFYYFNVLNPVCSPSRTAVMTGHFPARYSIHQHFSGIKNHIQMGMPDWLDPKAPMLPRIFKQAGYVTGHFGKWHLTNRDVSDAPLPTEYGYDEYGVFNCPGPQMPVNEVCDKAIDFIKRHQNEPFFINLWIHETHTPHYPSEKSLKRFAQLDEQHRVYASVVADGDERVGRVLDTLKELKMEDNTLVVFTSDNGPEVTGSEKSRLGDDNSTGAGLGTFYSVGTTGGLRGRKRSLYEGGVKVPFLVRWPGKVPAGKINKSVEIAAVDLLPTFCAAAEIKLPEDYKPDGENRLAAFKGEQLKRTKPIFWEWRGTSAADNWPRLAVRDGDWKLLTNYDQSRIELYQIPQDWPEGTNAAAQNPDVVKKLTEMVLAWKAALPADPDPKCFSTLRQNKKDDTKPLPKTKSKKVKQGAALD